MKPDQLQGQGRPRKGSELKTLADCGITRQQAYEWKKMAAIPEEEFESILREPNLRVSKRRLRDAIRKQKNVISADVLPSESLLAWASELSPAERRMVYLALRLTGCRTVNN